MCNAVHFRCVARLAVQFQKEDRHDEAGAFVPLNERMILYQPEGVAGREVKQVGLAVGEKVLRLAERRSDQTLVAHTRQLGQIPSRSPPPRSVDVIALLYHIYASNGACR